MGLLLDERRQSADTNSIEPQLKIRNLETVQGDEADVVLFSVAFSAKERDPADASAAARRVPLQFGPLNRRGGERRLNVAVSRARKEMVVFCSFDPEDLVVRETSSLGIRLLRQFLEIARDGVEHSGELKSHASTSIDYHLADISEALRAEGIRVGERIGLSRFKVDLALGRAGEDGWRVAVLLDGPTWAEAKSTYEREILPITILDKVRRWQAVLRVWLPSWLDERDRIVSELVNLVNTDPPPAPSPPETEPWPITETPTHHTEENPERDVPAPLGGTTTPSTQDAPPPHDVPDTPPNSAHDLRFTPFPEDFVALAKPSTTSTSAGTAPRLSQPSKRSSMLKGPVEIERLCKTAACCFDLKRVRSERLRSLMRLVPRQKIRRGSLGTFVWPDRLDPESWGQYRRDENSTDRSLDEVAPEEISNAMVDYAKRGGSIAVEELDRTRQGSVRDRSAVSSKPRATRENTLVGSPRGSARNFRATGGPDCSRDEFASYSPQGRLGRYARRRMSWKGLPASTALTFDPQDHRPQEPEKRRRSLASRSAQVNLEARTPFTPSVPPPHFSVQLVRHV